MRRRPVDPDPAFPASRVYDLPVSGSLMGTILSTTMRLSAAAHVPLGIAAPKHGDGEVAAVEHSSREVEIESLP